MIIEQHNDIASSFLGWQCRLRQYVVRRSDGRPSAGMCPRIELPDGHEIAPIISVIVKQEPAHAIAQFRQIVKQTHDPLERYEAAIRTLQNVYYQYPREFCDSPTALFQSNAKSVIVLLQAKQCTLFYRQANQSYVIPCAVTALEQADPAYQATYWHNAMFNPKLGNAIVIAQFTPDWTRAVAQTD